MDDYGQKYINWQKMCCQMEWISDGKLETGVEKEQIEGDFTAFGNSSNPGQYG
jgi:hypothetical protein